MVKHKGGLAQFLRLTDNTDTSWRKFGRNDPYFGVFSAERFRSKNLNEETLTYFFASGDEHITYVMETARRHVTQDWKADSALDFGCGVGRLVLPLSRHFGTVVGVDISEDYIAEAMRNCERRGIKNIEFFETVEQVAAGGKHFDLVHSSIVFNHIPWVRGRAIVGRMFALLNPGGVMAIQVLHRHKPGALRRVVRWTRRNFLPANWIVNIAQKRPMFDPLMRGHAYPLDNLLPYLVEMGADHIHVQTEPTTDGESFAFVFCRNGNGMPTARQIGT